MRKLRKNAMLVGRETFEFYVWYKRKFCYAVLCCAVVAGFWKSIVCDRRRIAGNCGCIDMMMR